MRRWAQMNLRPPRVGVVFDPYRAVLLTAVRVRPPCLADPEPVAWRVTDMGHPSGSDCRSLMLEGVRLPEPPIAVQAPKPRSVLQRARHVLPGKGERWCFGRRKDARPLEHPPRLSLASAGMLDLADDRLHHRRAEQDRNVPRNRTDCLGIGGWSCAVSAHGDTAGDGFVTALLCRCATRPRITAAVFCSAPRA